MSDNKFLFLPIDEMQPEYVMSVLSESVDWGLTATGIPDAHKVTRGTGIKVAVLDTGCFDHDDLCPNIVAKVNCTTSQTGADLQGHGCSLGNTQIWTDEHGIISLESLYKKANPDSILISPKENSEILFINNSRWFTASYSKANKNFVHSRIEAVHKLFYVGDIYTIKTKNETLTLTPWHPTYVVTSKQKDNLSITTLPADQLKVGDLLLCGNIENTEKYISIDFNNHSLDLDDRLAFWLGLLFSNGSVNSKDSRIEFSDNNQDLVNDFATLTKSIFDVGCKNSMSRTGFKTAFYSPEVKTILSRYFGIHGGPKSLTIELPTLLKKCSKSTLGAFTAGLIEAAGNVNTTWRIRLSTGYPVFAEQLSQVLKFHGIQSFVSTTDNSSEFGKGCQIEISPVSEILEHLKYKQGEGTPATRPRLQESIISIEKSFYQGFLYDLTVNENANYVANSMVISNTHVCGIIGAAANGFGIIGVAPEVQIIPIKVLDDSGHGGFDGIEAGIRAAIAHGVDIINMSLGISVPPPDSLHDAVKEAYAKGIILVAAAGNDKGAVNYPARFPEVIAVAAMDQSGHMASFSSRGDQIAVGAPGVNVYSTFLNNGYAILNGTSQASPFIAGVCALILSYTRKNPTMPQISNGVDMLKALSLVCDPAGRLITGKNGEFGYGIPKFANVDWNKL